MRVLVTGGAGFIGSHVVDAFVAAGHTVAVADNLSTGSRTWLNPKASFHAVDLRSARLDTVFAIERPEVVAHLAAQAAVGRSVVDPVFDASVNIAGGLNLLDCCRRFGVRRIIYSSSGGAGYGDTDVIPTPEEHPSRPASPYGITKVAIEHYVDALAPLWGMRGISLRYANIYGPRQNPQGKRASSPSSATASSRTSRCSSTATACRRATSSTWRTWRAPMCWRSSAQTSPVPSISAPASRPP